MVVPSVWFVVILLYLMFGCRFAMDGIDSMNIKGMGLPESRQVRAGILLFMVVAWLPVIAVLTLIQGKR